MKQFLSSIATAFLDVFCRLFRFAYIPYTRNWIGLGNRIKGLANFYALGYRRFVLMSNIHQWVTMPFKDLFEIEGCNVVEYTNATHILRYNVITMLFRRFVPTRIISEVQPFWSFIVPRRFYQQKYEHRRSFMPDKVVQSIDFRFGDIDEALRKYYRPFFEKLKPSKAVVERIQCLNLSKDVVSVQIRNTGIRADEKDVASIETIFKTMDAYSNEQYFFISAMNADIAQLFHERYGERCIELPNKNYASMVDAVADMWHLGHCRAMIASPISTFSEVAWWWGGAYIPVIHLKSECNQCDIAEE